MRCRGAIRLFSQPVQTEPRTILRQRGGGTNPGNLTLILSVEDRRTNIEFGLTVDPEFLLCEHPAGCSRCRGVHGSSGTRQNRVDDPLPKTERKPHPRLCKHN